MFNFLLYFIAVVKETQLSVSSEFFDLSKYSYGYFFVYGCSVDMILQFCVMPLHMKVVFLNAHRARRYLEY